MVNEERLRHMIKISGFDTNDGKACRPMMQYARKDYISLQLLRSFVTGTICFGLVLGLWGVYSMEELMKQINSMDLKEFITTLLMFYGGFMLVYLTSTCIVFHVKYTAGRRKVKRYYSSLRKINRVYEREERLKMPGDTDRE